MRQTLCCVYALAVALSWHSTSGDCWGQTVVRRDIRSLSPSELTAYRDAFRQIQAAGGAYAEIAGNHGCPDYYCHTDSRIFLPWHRAYVLKMEKALQGIDSNLALHYWDWTSDHAIQNGIAATFTAQQYQSGSVTYSNPLRRFQYQCGGLDQFTRRFPDQPFLLESLRTAVNNAYGQTTFLGFSSSLSGPHGGLHGWVGGEMGSTTYAAYDPIFWAHHANVDRQWAHWQDGPNHAAPTSTVQQLDLEPFGVKVNEVLDYRSLGYTYAPPVSAVVPFVLVSTKGRLIFKNVELPGGENRLGLIVDDWPEHPRDSFRVYVFIGQPDATIDDVSPDNEHFAGYFGVFGGNQPHSASRSQPASPRWVLDLTPTLKKVFQANKKDGNRADLEITLIVTDVTGEVVDASKLPFQQLSIGPPDRTGQKGRDADATERRRDAPKAKGNRGSGEASSKSGGHSRQSGLIDRHGALRQLAEFRGQRVVLVFFLGFQCEHCAQQLMSLAEGIQDVGTTVICITADEQSVRTQDGTKSLVLLADPSYLTFKKFGCFHSEPTHGTFILDREGKVVWKNTDDLPFTNMNALQVELAKLG